MFKSAFRLEEADFPDFRRSEQTMNPFLDSSRKITEKAEAFFRKPSGIFGGTRIRFDYAKLKGGA